MKKILYLKDISIAASPKVRAEIREDTVKEYREVYASKNNRMPEPHVFKHNGEFIVGDGLHRVTAMQQMGIKASSFEVHEGGMVECLKFALTANLSHGLRRTSADKRAGVWAAIKQFPAMSNNELSKVCAVDDHTVAAVRSEMENALEVKVVSKRQGADGKMRPAVRTTSEIPKLKSQNAKDSAKKPLPEVRDETGFIIPEKAIIYWERREEVTQILSAVSRIKGLINDAVKNKDALFHEINVTDVLSRCSMLYDALKVALPHAVCPTCQGKLLEKCQMCGGKGLISKHRFGLVPKEIVAMRAKVAK